VHCENYTKLINTKCMAYDYKSRWYIQLPQGFKGLIVPIAVATRSKASTALHRSNAGIAPRHGECISVVLCVGCPVLCLDSPSVRPATCLDLKF
jgi:hypothetical protein